MERRRSPRFGLTVPVDVQVSVLQDVQIEHAGDGNFIVLSPVPGIRGEEVTLRIGPSDAVQMTMTVRTTSSEPRLVDGRLRHRIHVTTTGAIALSTGPQGSGNTWHSAAGTTTVFIRRYLARIINLSRGGCMLDLASRLPAGTVATVTRGPDGAGEPVRVSFLHERRGGSWPYGVGAEFLSLEAPTSRSLRAVARQMELDDDRKGLVDSGQESRIPLTTSLAGPIDILSIVCAEAGNPEPPRVNMTPRRTQSNSGRPLALVGDRTNSPHPHETRSADD